MTTTRRNGRNPDVRQSGLERRRDALQRRAAVSADATTALATLDRQLENNATQLRKDNAALQAARDTVAELKKSITVADKKGAKMQSARKKARSNAAKAAQRTQSAETKYDSAVLAEMVAKEKESDLSAHPDTADSARATAPRVAHARRKPPAVGAGAKTSKPQSATTRPRAVRPGRT